MNIVGITAVFVGFFAAAAFVTYRGSRGIAQAIRSQTWPEVLGQIISSHVAEQTKYDEGDYTVYQAQVTYAYTVGDTRYIGSRIAIGTDELWGSETAAAKYCAALTQGRQMYVAYDPADPAQSLLQPGLSWKACFPLAGGVLALVVSTRIYLSLINDLQQ